jgi:hypothetical protein
MAPLTSQKCPANAPIQNVLFRICLCFFSTTYDYITHHQCYSKLNISATSQYFQLASSHFYLNSPSNMHTILHSLAQHPPFVLRPVGNCIIPSSPFQLVPLPAAYLLTSASCIIITPLRHSPYAKTIISDMPCLLLELELSRKVLQ